MINRGGSHLAVAVHSRQSEKASSKLIPRKRRRRRTGGDGQKFPEAYRDGLKGGPVVLSNSQADPVRNFLQPIF